MFFMAPDIARFAKFKDHMGGAIKAGELDPAFAIFSLFQQRVEQRVDYARGLLKQDIFDFSGDDRWHYDREDAPWAANDAEVEQLWKQSVRNRSEEHTTELQTLMRISYAVFCLKKKKKPLQIDTRTYYNNTQLYKQQNYKP